MDQPSPLAMLPADVAQVDETGYVWTFLDRAAEPDRILPSSVVVAGDEEEPSPPGSWTWSTDLMGVGSFIWKSSAARDRSASLGCHFGWPPLVVAVHSRGCPPSNVIRPSRSC